MKRNKWAKKTAWLLVLLLVLSLMPASIQAEAKGRKTKLKNTKITMTVGKSKKIKLLNNSKKVKWSTSNKKVVKITKKSKKYVKVKALKTGTAKITAKVGSKKYTCKVTVKAKKGFFSTTEATTEEPKKPTTETVTEAPKKPTTEKPVETPNEPTTEKKPEDSKKPTTEEKTESTEKPTTEEKTETTEKPTDPSEETENPAQRYTRLKWVELLLDSVGTKVITEEAVSKDPNGNALYSYVDLKEETANLTVETAVGQGILVPSEGQEEDVYFFYPEDLTTREFATVTAARALGYMESQNAPECSDKESLEYPLWDAVAVNIGLIGLQDGCFNGKEELTGADAKQMLAKIKEIKAEETAVPEKVVDIQYADDLVKDSVAGLTDYLVTETEIGYQITINNYTGTIEETGIEAGKPIYLPADQYQKYPDGFVCRVAGVEISGNQIRISGTPIESVFEVMDSFQLSGEAAIEEIILADGVTVKNAEDEESIDSHLSAESGEESDGLTEEEMDSKLLNVSGDSELPVEFTLEQSLGKFCTVAFDLEKPTISYDIKCSMKEIERFKFVMSDCGKISVNVGGEGGTPPPDTKFDLVTIPVNIGKGFYVDVLVSLQTKISASGSIDFYLASKVGVDLQAEKRIIHQLDLADVGQSSEISLTTGPEVDVLLHWLKLKKKGLRIADLSVSYGCKASSVRSVELDAEGKSLFCRTRTLNDYLSIGVGSAEDTLLNKLGISLEFTMTPHRLHCSHNESVNEDGPFVFVENCRAVKNLYGTVLDKNGEEVYFERMIIRSKTDPEQEFCVDNRTKGKYICKIPNGKYEIIVVWDRVIKVRKDIEVDGNTCYDIREGGIIDSGSGTGYSWSITEDGNFECEVDETADMAKIKEIIQKYRWTMISAYIYGTVGEKSMDNFFGGCTKLVSVNLSKLNTQKVNRMDAMFCGCDSLTELDLSNFNTSRVETMGNMFSGCSSMTKLDLSSFDTSQVKTMYGMFSECSSITELDITGFDTSNVENMDYMFLCCCNLTELDLSNFNTHKVASMIYMFDCCCNLVKVDVSSFDTSNTTDIGCIFRRCRSLSDVNVSNFNTSKMISMSAMFSGCSSLEELDVSNFDTSNVTNMSVMFSECSNLTELDLSNFDTSNVELIYCMFAGCSSLIELDLSNFDTSNVTNMRDMFSGCANLQKIDISSFNTSNLVNIRGMFAGCSNLIELDLSNFDISSEIDMWDTFSGCKAEIIPDWYIWK